MRLPYTTSYKDRHGKVRWRFRYKGRRVELPGEPGSPEFERAYQAALANREPATIAVLSTVKARSLRACWVGVQKSAEWKRLETISQTNQRRVAERFLMRKVGPGSDLVWGDAAVADVKRRHIKGVLGELADTPHAAGQVLRCIRKLVGYALDQEWIEVDPTYRLVWRPPLKGHRAWTVKELLAFQNRWPTGSTPRLVYALALYTGTRRADLVGVRWDDMDANVLTLDHNKTGASVTLDVLPPLAVELAATPRRGPTVIVTAYGKPFSEKSLTGRFRDWAEAAGLEGCTIHGLRKTLGGLLADSGANVKQIQAVLGHTTLQQAELYTKSADKKAGAQHAMALLHERLKKVGLG